MLPVFPFTKTRIAPTPSGFLHAGNALNFLLAAALAKRFGAGLLLRIDDLDKPRIRPEYIDDIFETLQFLGIRCNEGPQDSAGLAAAWSQQHRMPLYTDALAVLKARGRVFACTCSRTQQAACTCRQKALPLEAPNTSWRLLTTEEPMAVKQADGRFLTAALPPQMKDFMVRRKDGLPAYQLASVVDDLHFGIDFIVRGEDLWPSTLAQLQLAQMLEKPAFGNIAFHHHRLLKNDQGEKLSKSAGAASVRHWRGDGRSVAEFVAYLGALLQVARPATSSEDLLATLDV